MLKLIATNVVISPGYNGAPALRFSDNGESVRFRIGKKVYDPRAENSSRWVNLSVKAFGGLCERIKKMQLKDGSFVNLEGRLDEDKWIDQNTQEQKSQMVLILEDIEYASGGEGKSKDGKGASAASTENAPQNTSAPAGSGFTGYETFGGESFFDEG